jgi:hypothetical protein
LLNQTETVAINCHGQIIAPGAPMFPHSATAQSVGVGEEEEPDELGDPPADDPKSEKPKGDKKPSDPAVVPDGAPAPEKAK